LKVAYSWDEGAKLAKVSIQQVQKLGETVLLFHLPLKIRFKSGETVTDGVAEVSRQAEDFYFSLPAKPGIVRVDPDFTWLANIEFSLPAEMLSAQLSDPGDVIGRIFAIEQLEKRGDRTAVEKIQGVLNTDAFWGVRVEAARALRRIHNEDAHAALLSASKNQSEARVRRAIVDGLGAWFRSDTPETVGKLVAGETNLDIRVEAIQALSAYPVEQVKETLLGHLRSSSYRQMLANAAITAMRAQQSAEYLDPLLAVLREREAEFPSGAWINGLNTLAALAAEQENKSAIREFLIARIHHPRRSIQLAVIRALGALGDPQAIGALQTFAGAASETPQRPAAEAAIRQIRERKPQSAEVNTLRGEVLELQKQNRELKEAFEQFKKQVEAKSESAEPAKKRRSESRRK
ncbi:MAG: HEAT repeat domain-containing protein, partial [Verrucomicrobiae bacterium]|nr:HEAT repeat domain-containing protein [Verrucomicrobiae bacterium]